MTDVLKTPEKSRIRRALIASAFATLAKDGWRVGKKEKGGVRGRVRKITKSGRTRLAAIRTSQDGWIAFPRDLEDTKWVTLSDVDVVVAAAIHPEKDPNVAQVHIFEAKELRDRFDRAYAARQKAGHQITLGRGIWISLYHPERDDEVYYVGAGIGLLHKPIATVPLDEEADSGGAVAAPAGPPPPNVPPSGAGGADDADDFEPLTIAQAKVRLARTLGVEPTSIKITVEA